MKNIQFTLIILILVPNILSAQKDTLRKSALTEVIISAKMKEMYKNDSPIPIENYTPVYFKKAAVNNLLDATQQITGLRPQLNCSVCNTGDIHMNGMEGAYTSILIDGMPIVSSLSSIYGLSGIPLSMVERIEVIKGPAAAQFGSEAMAGSINIITKNPDKLDLLNVESNVSSYGETNTDVLFNWGKKKRWSAFSSFNIYHFLQKIDLNNDLFTDIALQKRVSIFTKIKAGTSAHPFQLGIRVFKENRWGGELTWEDKFKGGDSVYGELINTDRVEVIQSWTLPFRFKPELQNSYVYHQQQSFYGKVKFDAFQHTLFSQLLWKKQISTNDFLFGISNRIQHYNDNTVTTPQPTLDILPGVFIQHEKKWKESWNSLVAFRADYHQKHGVILSPRLSVKYKSNEVVQYRLGVGRGFRVVNVFTEDHAALTGDRKINIVETLNPETSINTFFAIDHFSLLKRSTLKTEIHLFYTHFYNRIQANYNINPNEIVYQNLKGYSVSRGLNLKFDLQTEQLWNAQVGLTVLDAFEMNKDSSDQKLPIMFSSLFNLNANVSYSIPKLKSKIDYQLFGYSPMRLPVLPNDFRPEYSDWYAIHQIQYTWEPTDSWEVYFSLKNIFNFLPKNPIMRSFDPFDKQVHIDNPNGFTFDTTYGYAPMQGRRVLVGFRYKIVRNHRVNKV